MSKENNIDLRKRFFRLGIVNIISNLMVPLASWLDLAFLGHLSDIRYLTGVALASILFNYLFNTLGFLRMSTTATTAQAVGSDDLEQVILILWRNGLLALFIGIALLVLQQPLREIGFTVLSGSPEDKISGKDYYDALIWSTPATLLNLVLLGWFLGLEKNWIILLISFLGNGVKLLLNYFFIVYCDWGSTGAGIGTACSQYIILVIGIILSIFALPLQQCKPALFQRIFAAEALKAIFFLNRDIFIRTLAIISTFAIFSNLSSAFGTLIFATNSLILQVVTLGVYLIDGLVFATETLVGISKSQGDGKALLLLMKMAGGISLTIGLALAGVFYVFPEPLFGLLTNHDEVIEEINIYVGWLFAVLGFGALAFILDAYFLGLTEVVILRNSSLISTLLVFLPMAIASWHWQNPQLLWLALVCFMLSRLIILGLALPKTFSNCSQQRVALVENEGVFRT